MKKHSLPTLLLSFFLIISTGIQSYAYKSDLDFLNHKKNKPILNFAITDKDLNAFFAEHTKFQKYKSFVFELYKNNKNTAIWHDNEDVIELAHLLNSKVNNMRNEIGITPAIPYKFEIDQIFKDSSTEKPSKTVSDILITCMYIYYDNVVYGGLSEKQVKGLGWYLPKKHISYTKILDSLLMNPSLLKENDAVQFSQYYKLKDYLKKYKDIEASNQWKRIDIDSTAGYKEYKPQDESDIIAQIRHQLFVFGDLKRDSQSKVYDQELMDGVLIFKKRHGLKELQILDPTHIRLLNIPMETLIHKIMVNMERCRWIPPQLEKQKKFVMVNIPSFLLYVVKNGNYEFTSKVFLGSEMNKTVIFTGKMNKIVFSPYWTVPRSIVVNELEFQMSQDPKYLEKQNIEKTSNGQYRQKPGPNNSLGLVKFLFPNPNDIYIHDTPQKTIFNFDSRGYSHGCINIEKAKELAYTVLEDDPNWTTAKIDDAMSGKKETPYTLKTEIPVYIGYFTAWVNDDNQISFFGDIYSRDDHLYELLLKNADSN